jgi:DNA-binding beta-propeller fold protein YncE
MQRSNGLALLGRFVALVLFCLAAVPAWAGPPYNFLAVIQGSFGPDNSENFNDQTYAAIDPLSHAILVSNGVNDNIVLLTATATFFTAIPPIGLNPGGGSFNFPTGIAVDPSSRNMVVADSLNNRAQIFTPNAATWTYSATFGGAGSGAGKFAKPYGIAIDPVSHEILLADSGNNRIEIFNAAGQFLAQFGASGNGNGQFNNPQGIAIDPASRNIIVADGGNSRVQIFDLTTHYLAKFGSKGSGNGQFFPPTGDPSNFTSPMGVAVDPGGGNIVVSDAGNNRIEVFSAAGQFLSAFGARGNGDGQFLSPVGLAIDPLSCNLVVVDYGNKRVQIFTKAAQGGPPTATTNPPSAVTNANGIFWTMHGTVSTENCGQAAAAANVSFQYGFIGATGYANPATIPFSASEAATPATVPAGVAHQQVSAPWHFVCNVTGRYRLATSNAAGTVYGASQYIYTPSCE